MNVRDTHRAAMRYAEQAKLASQGVRGGDASDLMRRAFELEREAAQLLLQAFDEEPTRSVLYRSAATLALECGELAEAKRLAYQGLAGNPPFEIANEIREVIDEEEFQRHLSKRGVTLQPEEFQVSVVGPVVAAGLALYSAIIPRVENFRNLVLRTGERIAGLEYRARGRPTQVGTHGYEFFVGTPREGSFAFSLHIGQPDQISFPGMAKGAEVVREIFDCFDVLESEGKGRLRQRIGSDAYYANFVSLAEKIGPDGDMVRFVGLTSTQGVQSRHVRLESKLDLAEAMVPDKVSVTEKVSVQGVLRWANAVTGQETVRIVDADNKSHGVRIPPGVDDIVKPYWLDEVTVTGVRDSQGFIVLEHIDSVRRDSP